MDSTQAKNSMVGSRRVFIEMNAWLCATQELGEEIRKLCADLTVKSEEIAQYGKEKEALQKLVDAGIRQTQSEYMKKMDQQKQVRSF